MREPTDGVPANKFLFAGTVPANNLFHFFLPKNPFLRGKILREPTDGVPANKFLFAGIVPANKF